MSGFGSAANLIRCVGLIVLCGLSILTVACGATPTPGPLGVVQVKELVAAVQRTEWGEYFYAGYVYQRDVTPVQTWEIQGRALTRISPEAADQKRAAIKLGCLPDYSVATGSNGAIVITSPTDAEATFNAVELYRYMGGVLQVAKVNGRWQVLPEPVLWPDTNFDCGTPP